MTLGEISNSQICTWRKQLREGKLAGAMPSLPVFAKVQVAELTPPAPRPTPCLSGFIQIELPGSLRVNVDAGVVGAADVGVPGVRRDRHAQGRRWLSAIDGRSRPPHLPGRTAPYRSGLPESGRAAFLKGFGRRQAYESLGSPNPRAASGALWGFRFPACWGAQQHGICGRAPEGGPSGIG